MSTDAPTAEVEINQLRELIMWALGEGGAFPDRPDDWSERKYKPWFWWRTELRKRFNDIQPSVAHWKPVIGLLPQHDIDILVEQRIKLGELVTRAKLYRDAASQEQPK